jgi:hypothetical protein
MANTTPPNDTDDENEAWNNYAHPEAEGDTEAYTQETLPGELVTVARFLYLYEAELLAGRLESEGVPAYIPDVMTVTVDPLIINSIGGIRVQVPSPYLEQAREIVGAMQQRSKPEPSRPKFITHEGKKMRLNNGVCMECGKAGFYITVAPFWRSLVSGVVAVGVDLPGQPKRNCYCNSCGATWAAG